MVNKVILDIDKTLTDLREEKNLQEKRLKELRGKEKLVLCAKKARNGSTYYSVRKKGEKGYRYIGSASKPQVNEIKEARYLKMSLSRLEKDIKILNKTRSGLVRTDYDSINAALPKVYQEPLLQNMMSGSKKALDWKKRMESIKATQPVYHPEELNKRTDDGNYVRSMSEANIYNYLLSIGVTFIYELPIKLNGHRFIPDFCILSEIDYKTVIIIEHQGMMDVENYRNRFYRKFYEYMKAGYVQGRNIFFTFDSLDGGFDKTPIEDIIRTRVRPA